MDKTFQIVVMGCTGGPYECNLSGYLLSPIKEEEWIVLDAGTLLTGIDAAFAKNSLSPEHFPDPKLQPSAEMLVHQVKAYLISHAHLDHITGLVLNSQIDTTKSIYGIDPTIDNFRDHIFNGTIWPNYGDEGFEPILKKYHYVRLPLHREVAIEETSMHVEAYLLNHPGGYPSTAFLIEYQGDYILYFGDTASDSLEREKHLERVWRRIAPLINEERFKGMMLECSYSHKDGAALFGHLDTKLMMKELHRLSEIAKNSLEGLNVIVTHRKQSVNIGEDTLAQIEEELRAFNDLGVHFIFPNQGDKIII